MQGVPLAARVQARDRKVFDFSRGGTGRPRENRSVQGENQRTTVLTYGPKRPGVEPGPQW